jgi:hypothetical protein
MSSAFLKSFVKVNFRQHWYLLHQATPRTRSILPLHTMKQVGRSKNLANFRNTFAEVVDLFPQFVYCQN